MTHYQRLNRFAVAGLSPVYVNFFFMVILAGGLNFHMYLFKNMANGLSVEIGIIYSFLPSRFWTWTDMPRRQGQGLLLQLVSFNLSTASGLLIRVILFAVIENCEIPSFLNLRAGVSPAKGMNFLFHDRPVFGRLAKEQIP